MHFVRLISLTVLLVLLGSPAAATERCDIRYSVRLIHPGHGVDTGSAERFFSTCVANLTVCHTQAEELAAKHASETLSPQGGRPDLDTIQVIDIDSDDHCSPETRAPAQP